MEKIETEIIQVAAEIKKVTAEIDAIVSCLKRPFGSWTDEEKGLHGTNLDQLREEMKQLREERKQLRRKEEQLREEKEQLRKEEQLREQGIKVS
jgi:chromosome segregation ATPase